VIFSFVGAEASELFGTFSQNLRRALESRGHDWIDTPDTAQVVFNFFPGDRARPFRRRARSVFVVGVCDLPVVDENMVDHSYPALVRSLSNLLIVLDDRGRLFPDAHFMTLERGHYIVSGQDDPQQYGDAVYARIEPLATSRLVIENVFEPDLPEALWDGTDAARSLSRAGQRLAELDLLPSPFALEGLMSERDIRHLKKLFGFGGLSYGNLSARHDNGSFWMSASGVDKSRLSEIGRDILLVKDYDAERGAMVLSVPPGVEPRRVSVDAIEHWMIYRTHPEVGAILHIHAWMDDIRSTEFNYPCGTYELGEAVAEIVDEAPDPSRCVVGLKNHGLTITGHSLDEIFERIEGRVQTVVPMT
jgi:ribulose-5-phosphate 4-epimerase/fuculose-1-phosphate aldolase